MTEDNLPSFLRPNYMDDSEIGSTHYYFNQVAYPKSYNHLIELILQRRFPNINESEFKNIVKRCFAIATISKFFGNRFLGDKVYAFIDGKIELIGVGNFEEPELENILNGPFYTFEELKSAYNEFLEKLTIINYCEFIESQSGPYEVIDDEINDKELEFDLGSLYMERFEGENEKYSYYSLNRDQTLMHLTKYQSEIAKFLNIPENEIYENIDLENIRYIGRFRIENDNCILEGIRYYGKYLRKWIMIYDYNFKEPEGSISITGPFKSISELKRKFEYFIFDKSEGTDDIEEDDIEEDNIDYYPDYEEEYYSPYEGTYARDVEGLSDDFIDNALGGDPEAYWNID
jgi:hypothetical protein